MVVSGQPPSEKAIELDKGEKQIVIIVDGAEKINIFLRGDKPIWGKIALSSAGAGKSLFDDLVIY